MRSPAMRNAALNDQLVRARRLRVLALVQLHSPHIGATRATNAVAADEGISPSTVWRWMTLVAGLDIADWHAALGTQRPSKFSLQMGTP